ncbi:hypothetical protein NM208_g2168 [Fusarium decemcellulare]|uniref:Uncharacterized protein n=1 Tax=Fusarium decemcellulare TaxID=57161 RepID=A0ACC1STJ1_9HYPO|nr:hypothetical protein NM208_g2168 [Fusarium decemcellulare]
MANETVLLTGASGFLGSHIAQQLLYQGYTVKATFRSDKKSQLFKDAFPGHKVETCIVKDITSPDAFAEAIKGVDHVIHSASPFTFHVDDIQRDLIDPAVNGTKAMLEAVASSEIKRLVITSSFAAVISPRQGSRPGYTYTGMHSPWSRAFF